MLAIMECRNCRNELQESQGYKHICYGASHADPVVTEPTLWNCYSHVDALSRAS
jgi:hypothetical protein